MNIYQMNMVVDVFGQGQSGRLSGQSRTPIGTVEDAYRDSRGRLSLQSIGKFQENLDIITLIWYNNYMYY